ncbi:MAG: GAF domain-containing protein, partial [Oceanidesulfovibrio sp.]
MADDRLDTVFFRPSTPDVAFRRIEHLLRASQSLVRIESLELLLPKLLEMAQDVTGAEAASILLYNPEAEELCFYHALDSQTSSHSGRSTTCLKNSSDHTVCGSGYIFQFAQQEPFVPEALGSIRLKLGEGIAGSVAQERRSALVSDAKADPRFSQRA